MNCEDCKEKPCCKNEVMPIEISLDFIFRLVNHFNMKPENIFNKYCDLTPILLNPPYIYEAGIALKYPCPFFNNGCDIHQIKPNTCLTFPSMTIMSGQAEAFPDYPCLNSQKERPNEKEIKFSSEIIKGYIEENGKWLEMEVYFKNKPLQINIIDLKQKYQIINQYLNLIETDVPEINIPEIERIKKITLKVLDAVKKEINNKIQKKTIFIRIRMMKDEQKKRMEKMNKKYLEIRKKFNM